MTGNASLGSVMESIDSVTERIKNVTESNTIVQ